MKNVLYEKIIKITLPITFQCMISYGINMLDTFMLGQLGERVLSAASLGNQIFFLFSLIISGIANGAVVLCSQYYGKKDILSLKKIAAMNLKIAFIISLFFMFVLAFFSENVMRILTNDREVIETGAVYLKYIAVSYLCFGMTNTFLILLRSIQNVRLSFVIYLVSFAANVFFNYMFIYGNFGAPKMGIGGAAVGTVIARGIELIILVIYLKFYEKEIFFNISMVKMYDKTLAGDAVKYGIPVAAGEFFWGMGLTVHTIILGHLGQEAVVASSICNILHQFILSFVQGLGNSSAVIMGEIVGKGDIKGAERTADRLLKIFWICGLTAGLFLLILKKPFLNFYNLESDTFKMAEWFMVVYAVLSMFRAVATPIIAGIFWGSGDTKFAALIDILFLWLMIPIGFFAAFHLKLYPPIVLLILRLETPIKLIVCMAHLKKNKWIKVLVREPAV